MLDAARATHDGASDHSVLQRFLLRGRSRTRSLARSRVERRVALRASDLDFVRHALVDVVEKPDGTAHAFAIPGLPFAGKTGSADAPPRGGVDTDEDAWFVAYAPPDAVKMLVAARIERADVGRDATWAAVQVLGAWHEAAR